MNRFFESLPIRTKLTLLMFLNSALILGMMSVFFVINEVYLFRQDMIGELTNIARMTALNTASAITFHDRGHAEKILNSLSVEPNIKEAAIYMLNGDLFAQYRHHQKSGSAPDNKQRLRLPEKDKGFMEGIPFWDTNFNVFETILLDGEKLGTVYIRSGMGRLWRRLGMHLLITVVLILISCSIAWLLSSKLQNVFTGPILKLAAMMKTVSAEKDYSIRANHPPRMKPASYLTDSMKC